MTSTGRHHSDDGVDMTFEERRHDELTRAPKSDPGDDAPRVKVSKTAAGHVRIDVADTAAVRPGKTDRRGKTGHQGGGGHQED
jgi:hypothetical protein